MIQVLRTGKNPTMRSLPRTHGVQVQKMHDQLQQSYLVLVFETTDRMSADIFTKAFTDVAKWKRLVGSLALRLTTLHCNTRKYSNSTARFMAWQNVAT